MGGQAFEFKLQVPFETRATPVVRRGRYGADEKASGLKHGRIAGEERGYRPC